jgi:hypothetical protein
MFAERQEFGSSYFTEIFCFLRLSLASLGPVISYMETVGASPVLA